MQPFVQGRYQGLRAKEKKILGKIETISCGNSCGWAEVICVLVVRQLNIGSSCPFM